MTEQENNKSLEEKIACQFNELSDSFPLDVDDQDKRTQMLYHIFDPMEGKSLLDIGCGKGRFAAKLLKSGAHVTGVELSEELLKAAQQLQSGTFVRGSATSLDFPDESFDGVYCIEVLQHVPDHNKAIAEMARVVKKGGHVVIIDHNKFCFLRTVWKKCKEQRNQWMYTKDFPYSEKVFTPGEIKQQLLHHGLQARLRFLGENGLKEKSGFKRLVATISQRLGNIIPSFSYTIAWIGTKK